MATAAQPAAFLAALEGLPTAPGATDVQQASMPQEMDVGLVLQAGLPAQGRTLATGARLAVTLAPTQAPAHPAQAASISHPALQEDAADVLRVKRPAVGPQAAIGWAVPPVHTAPEEAAQAALRDNSRATTGPVAAVAVQAEPTQLEVPAAVLGIGPIVGRDS